MKFQSLPSFCSFFLFFIYSLSFYLSFFFSISIYLSLIFIIFFYSSIILTGRAPTKARSPPQKPSFPTILRLKQTVPNAQQQKPSPDQDMNNKLSQQQQEQQQQQLLLQQKRKEELLPERLKKPQIHSPIIEKEELNVHEPSTGTHGTCNEASNLPSFFIFFLPFFLPYFFYTLLSLPFPLTLPSLLSHLSYFIIQSLPLFTNIS